MTLPAYSMDEDIISDIEIILYIRMIINEVDN